MNIDFGIKLIPQLKQSLELKIDQKLINKLNLLRMPYQELLNKIKKDAENNIVLKISKYENIVENIKDKYFNGNLKELSQKKDKEIESLSLDIKPSLEEHLLNQLYLSTRDGIEKKIGEELISNIDKDGYIRNYEVIRNNLNEKIHVKSKKIDNILKVIQSFEPQGVGARDLKECLLIQINEDKITDKIFNDKLNKLIRNHSLDIERGSIESIKKGLDINEEEYKALIAYVKGLDPFPGRRFEKKENNETIIPSFEIKEESGKYKVINLEETYGPKLMIKEKYLKMLDDPKLDIESKLFIKNKIKEAKQLIEDVKNRKYIIEKLLYIIVEKQKSFLKNGIYWLKPFQQDDAAKELNVHPSTISRASRGKYIQTPQGLFPLSFLLQRNQKGYSIYQIKKIIQNILLSEKRRKISDKKIMEILNKEGINIKRRTVAKYRKELNFGSSWERPG